MQSSTATPSSTGQGRELALLALCHVESYAPDEWDRALSLFWEHPPEGHPDLEALLGDATVLRVARRMAAQVVADRNRLDARIDQAGSSWRVARMARVDRNLVRLALCELEGQPKTPKGVVLSEAVRLASRYGSEASPRFVNGLLEALARAGVRTQEGEEG